MKEIKKEIKKNPYIAPTVKVVAFQVERGFGGSIPQSTNVLPTSQTETVQGGGWGTEETDATGWFN